MKSSNRLGQPTKDLILNILLCHLSMHNAFGCSLPPTSYISSFAYTASLNSNASLLIVSPTPIRQKCKLQPVTNAWWAIHVNWCTSHSHKWLTISVKWCTSAKNWCTFTHFINVEMNNWNQLTHMRVPLATDNQGKVKHLWVMFTLLMTQQWQTSPQGVGVGLTIDKCILAISEDLQ